MIEGLPRREREVFELLCRLEVATAAAVRAALPDTLSDSAVRTLLKRLEDRGLVSRAAGGDGFDYRPVPRTETVAAGALLVSVPVMALFYVAQRHLVAGLTAGGVKG